MDAKKLLNEMIKLRDSMTQDSFKLLDKIGQCEIEKKELETNLTSLNSQREELNTTIRVLREKIGE